MLLTDLSIFFSTPTLWCDNISALALANNPVCHARSKHIAVDYHFIREKVASKALLLRHIPSVDQFADIFTKSLPISHFLYLSSKLLEPLSP